MFTPNGHLAADKFCAFAHTRQPEVSGVPVSAKNLWVNAPSIVPDTQPELRFVVADFHFNPVRACVTEGVAQRLGGDPVDFVSEHRM
jgi:hypothetical protein